jgi:multidrug efflux pump subunit AcrA (membrane-fusion protein)
LDDAQLIDGPRTAEVARRAQHELSRKNRTPDRPPRIGLVAVTMSAVTVAVLTAGTVHGIRSDAQRALLGDQAELADQVADDGVLTALPDGRVQDVAASRYAALVANRTAWERAQAKVAAEAAQREAAQRVAAQREAAQRATAQRAAAQATLAADARARQRAAGQVSRSSDRSATVPSGSPQAIARAMLAARGWSSQWTCLNPLWQRESGWNHRARNPSSGAYGIPQALPGRKMASAGADWATNPATQIRWGLSYIASTYGTPCGAWAHSQSTGWY